MVSHCSFLIGFFSTKMSLALLSNIFLISWIKNLTCMNRLFIKLPDCACASNERQYDIPHGGPWICNQRRTRLVMFLTAYTELQMGALGTEIRGELGRKLPAHSGGRWRHRQYQYERRASAARARIAASAACVMSWLNRKGLRRLLLLFHMMDSVEARCVDR